MASARRMAGVELLLPFNLSTLQVEAIKEVVEHHFVRQFEVALVQSLHDLFFGQSLLFEFGGVFVAVLGPFLRQLRLTLGRDGRYINLAARYDRRRPPASGNLLRPLDVFSLGPTLSQSRVRSHRI